MKKLLLFTFLLSFSIPAFAEGVVSVGCGYFAVQLKSGATATIVPTAEEACTNLKPGTYPYFSPTLDQSCGHVVGYCITDINHMNGDLVHVWFHACPPHSSSIPTTSHFCTCDDGFVPDPAKTSCVPVEECQLPDVIDPATGQCVHCTVDTLPELPKDDACAQSLNKGLGKDVDGKCPQLDTRMTGANGQIQCFANKVAATNVSAWSKIPYDGPSATIRNAAYQKHLQDIWDKMIELDNLIDQAKISACRTLRDKVIAEKGCSSSDVGCGGVCTTGSHCLDYRPAGYSNHAAGTAFDVPRGTINRLLTELTPLPPAPMTGAKLLQARRFWIASWLAKPAACNLDWGGSFTNPGPDFVHFQLP